MIDQHFRHTYVEPLKLQQAVDNISRPLAQARQPRAPSRGSEETALIIGRILRAGVIASAAIILVGLLLLPFRSGGFTGRRLETFPHTLNEVWSGLMGLHPQAIIALGLLLLIATPVITVTAAAIAFCLERDRRFALIALTVLAILIASFLLGRNG